MPDNQNPEFELRRLQAEAEATAPQLQRPVWTPKDKGQTVDPPMGQAPVPRDESEHVIHPRPITAPNFVMERSDAEHLVALYDESQALVEHVAQGAMDGWMQQAVIHLRHTIQGCKSIYQGAKRELAEIAAMESEGGSGSGGSKSLGLIAIFGILALMTLLFPCASHAQILSSFPAQNNAAASAVGPAGAVTNPSGNDITVSPGPVYCSGALSYIHNTKLTLTGPPAIPAVTSQSGSSQLFYIFYSCSSDQVVISTFPPQGAGTSSVPIATVLQSNAAGSLSYTITDIRSVGAFPNSSDGIIPFGPGDCAWNATGTLGATTALNLQAIGASFAPVNSISTTAAGASTDNLTCNIHIPQRTTASKGAQLLDCVVYYGVQTTALTSLGAPTLNTITMPTPGTSETASTVTPVSLGAVTVTPVVGSANLGTTTAGAFFSEKVALNTPVFLNTDLQMIQYNQTFVQSAAAAQIVNTPGGVCHVVVIPN